MFTRTKNRKAISAVLTTLIILVASVVLGTGVVLYGTSLFQTGAQSSGITTQGAHLWVNSTSTITYVWGAAEVRNSGDKILSVDQINVRGTSVPFSNWYFDSDPTRVTAANYQSQLNYTNSGTPATALGMMQNLTPSAGAARYAVPATCPASTTFAINEYNSAATAPTMCFSKATGPISLKPGDKAVVYFQVPVGILTTVDSGSQSSVALFAGNVGAPQSVTVESKS